MNNGLAIDISFPIANPLKIHSQSIVEVYVDFITNL